MTYQELDMIFPYFVLAYGAVMTFTLNVPALMKLAEERFPQPLLQQMNAHRTLGIVCLFVGSVWTLQHIWYY